MKHSMAWMVWSSAVLLGPSGGAAQETAAERHAQATNLLKRVAGEISARCLADVRTLDGWESRSGEWRRELRDMLGLDPLPKRTPLEPQITGGLDRPAYRVEKLVYQSLPGLYVTGNFYVPKDIAKPLPTILYLCGHSPHPLGAKVQYQDRGQWYASHGFACLVLDTLEFGEVPGIHHGTHDLNLWNWLSQGYTPAGVEVWSAMRALDYLETRREVDRRRVGVTGTSGGGAMTWYLAALDDRVAAAAPVCSTWTVGSQAAHWVASGQCDCIYYHNTYGWDFPIVGALIAPRPLLILSGQKDPDFPPDGYHAVYQRAKSVYDLYAGTNSDRIREFDDNVGHSDPPQFQREARQWMTRWLKNDPARLPEEPASQPPKEKAEDLACLARLPASAANFRIQNEFIRCAPPAKPASPAAWTEDRRELMTGLRGKVFRWFPTEAIPFETQTTSGDGGWITRYGDYREVFFQSEAGARLHARLITPKKGSSGVPLVIQVKRPGDSLYFMDVDELLPLLGRCTVLVLDPRFTETTLGAGAYADIERTAAWCGRTLASMQVWDILRAVEWAVTEAKITPSEISLYGKGNMGVLSLYAALFDERVTQVVLNDPPSSHWHEPALLNVLRVTDIPEVAGALAPRRLVCLREFPAAFDPTRAIYQLLGAQAKMTVAGSLAEAIGWEAPGSSQQQ